MITFEHLLLALCVLEGIGLAVFVQLLVKSWKLNDIALARWVNEAETSAERLDFVLQYFSLNLKNPYILRPGYDEKRCMHCHIPEGFQHDSTCIWQKLYPTTSKLYSF